jgi:hypothetical protein
MGSLEQTAVRSASALKAPTLGDALPSARTVYSERLHQDILTLRLRGLVPLAIADILDISDYTVTRHLRELVSEGELAPTPRFFEQVGPKRELEPCRHCGKV